MYYTRKCDCKRNSKRPNFELVRLKCYWWKEFRFADEQYCVKQLYFFRSILLYTSHVLYIEIGIPKYTHRRQMEKLDIPACDVMWISNWIRQACHARIDRRCVFRQVNILYWGTVKYCWGDDHTIKYRHSTISLQWRQIARRRITRILFATICSSFGFRMNRMKKWLV